MTLLSVGNDEDENIAIRASYDHLYTASAYRPVCHLPHL